MKCRGRVAVATGAAGQGMGRSIALTLAREGARVVVNYRSSQESAQTIVDHILARGGEAIAVQADVFEADGCRHLVEQARASFGQVDICVIGPGAGWHPEPPQQVVTPQAISSQFEDIMAKELAIYIRKLVSDEVKFDIAKEKVEIYCALSKMAKEALIK